MSRLTVLCPPQSSAAELSTAEKRACQRLGTALALDLLPTPVRVETTATGRVRRAAEKAVKAAGLTTSVLAVRAAPRGLSELVGGTDHEHVVVVAEPAAAVRGLAELGVEVPPAVRDGALVSVGGSGDARVILHGDLPATFPYPLRDPSERRDRPFYYYNQSSVVPFRRKRDGVELLLIGSSKRKRLVFPKGIIEPGLSPEDSALKEAREEAGAVGRVVGPQCGAYTYSKWGAPCSCAVFAMEVERLLDSDDWAEPHRGRRWVAPAKAASLLSSDVLSELALAVAEQVG